MKIFVTGGTGVVGRPTVAKLLAQGHEVRGATRSDESAARLRAAGAEPVDVDLFDPVSVREAVVGSDVVAHLATNVPPFPAMLKAEAWELHNRLRTDATRNLVDAARAAGVPRFVKESITMVYADGGPEWLDERSPVMADPGLMNPALVGEEIALELADVATVTVLRFGLFYGGVGNRGTDDMLRMARRHLSMVTGKSWAFLTSVHADDAAAGVVASLAAPTGIYNVSDDEPLTRGRSIDAFASAFDTGRLFRTPGWLMRIVGGAPSSSLTASQRVSNRKLTALTGWSPTYRSQVEGWKAERETREATHA
jgi:nucleoside-diphosphate-sugar epimerase